MVRLLAAVQAVTAAEGVSGCKHVRVASVLLLLADLYARTRRVTLAEGLYRCCLCQLIQFYTCLWNALTVHCCRSSWPDHVMHSSTCCMLHVWADVHRDASRLAVLFALLVATALSILTGGTALPDLATSSLSVLMSSLMVQCRNAAKLLQMDPLKHTQVLSTPQGSHPSIGALLAWRYCQLLSALPKRESEAAAWHQTSQGLCKRGRGGWLDAQDSRLHWHGLSIDQLFGSMQQMKGGMQHGHAFVVDLVARRAYVALQ